MRRRLRYLAFEVVNGEQNIYSLVVALSKKLGVSREEIRIILQSRNSKMGLLCCSHLLVDELKKAISSEGLPIKVLGISGTIRAARRKFFPQHKEDGITEPCRR